MNINVLDQKNKATKLLALVFAFWIPYSILYFVLKYHYNNLFAGYLPLIGQVGLDVSLSWLTYNLYKKSSDERLRKIYLMFYLSFVAAIFADGIYNIGMNVLDVEYFYNINSFFEIPFIFFLLFQVIAWGFVFFRLDDKTDIKNKILYLPYIFVSAIIFVIFMFGIPWKIEHQSLIGIYQLIDTILEVSGFTVVTICLARAKDNTLRLASIGYLVIISSDLLIRNQVVSGIIPFLNPFETTWILGLLMIAIGFFFGEKRQLTLLPINKIQSYIAIWILNVWLFFLILFLLIPYFHYKNSGVSLNFYNENLLSVIIPFSIICVLISKVLSEKISYPLERLENIIRRFSNDEHQYISSRNKNRSNFIFEFIALENFIYDAFKVYKKKHFMEVEFSKIATQVAHDIKSPIFALNNYINEQMDMKDARASVAYSSINRINEIANNLLLNYKNSKNKKEEKLSSQNEVTEINLIIDDLVEEKKMEFKNKYGLLNIINNKSPDLCFALIDAQSFKRIISNIINNAAESIENKGEVVVSLLKNFNSIVLSIKDNGCGIPDHILMKIEEGNSFGKNNGHGLGLSHAFKYIKKWGAKYTIESEINVGTNFSIVFPIQDHPEWLQTEIYFSEQTTIVIVDDDYSIYYLWKNKFLTASKKNDNYKIEYLKSPEELSDYVNMNAINFKKTIFLIDFHFINSTQSGLDVVLRLSMEKSSVIVSSCYPDLNTKNIIEKNNIKFILKGNIPKIEIISVFKNPDLVLLDDKKFITKTWEFESKKYKKKIITFNSKDAFINNVDLFEKNTNIYLDSNLGNDTGENIAKYLHERGYTNLYITTGYDHEKFCSIPWIKGVIGKEPFFLKNQ